MLELLRRTSFVPLAWSQLHNSRAGQRHCVTDNQCTNTIDAGRYGRTSVRDDEAANRAVAFERLAADDCECAIDSARYG